MPAADLPAKGSLNYLQEELPQRLAKGPVTFDWLAQILRASATSSPIRRSPGRKAGGW